MKKHIERPGYMTVGQRRLIRDTGLNPNEWKVIFEDDLYLHIIPKDNSARQPRILDKK